MNSSLVTQVGGDHYKKMVIQPMEFIARNGLSFIEGSIVKYVSRCQAKNGVEDLRKAAHFIELHFTLIDREPSLFRAVRESLNRIIQKVTAAKLADALESVIHPEYYLAKNGINDPDAQHLITGVCVWRDRAMMSEYNKQTMIQAVRNLINKLHGVMDKNEMLSVDQSEDET